jgi:hypothetical protein
MARLLDYLTLPGGGGRAPEPPPPPAAPSSRARADASRRGRMQAGVGGSVRNIGGAQGLSVSDTARALKSLTGQ